MLHKQVYIDRTIHYQSSRETNSVSNIFIRDAYFSRLTAWRMVENCWIASKNFTGRRMRRSKEESDFKFYLSQKEYPYFDSIHDEMLNIKKLIQGGRGARVK